MGRLSSIAQRLLKPKYSFAAIKPSDVVVFYKTNFQFVKEVIPPNTSTFILHLDNELLQLHPKVIFWSFYFRFTKKAPLITSYCLALLHLVKPKVILTFIDNCPIFSDLSRLYPAEFVAIQNGARPESDFNVIPSLPTYMSWGNFEARMAEKYKVSIKNHFAVGSLKSSLFTQTIQAPSAKSYDICFISQYVPSFMRKYPWFDQGFKEAVSYTARFAEDHGLTVAVACRKNSGQEYNEEISYYREHSNNSKHFIYIPYSRELYSTYELMKKSKLTVTHHSSCGFEAYSLGEKSFFYDKKNRPGGPLEMAEKTFYCMESNDYGEFEAKLSAILAMTNEEFLSALGQDRFLFMDSRQGDTKNFIANHISKFLTKQHSSQE